MKDFRKLRLKDFKELFLKKPEIATYLIPGLIIVLYLFLFLGPAIKQSFRLLPQAAQLKSKIVGVKKEWAGIDSFNTQISRLNEKLNYYERSLPGEKEIPALLEYLSDAAKRLKVRITEIRPLEQDKSKAGVPAVYYKVPILLKAECAYHQLGRFLNKLESADRFMKIDDIKIEATPKKNNIHNIELIVVTYVMEK